MKIWKEKADPQKHKDYMSTSWVGGISIPKPKDNLIEKWVYFVKEGGFTFQFTSINQIEECIDYFSTKIHPSTRLNHDIYEHYWQTWHERLPHGITKKGKREKILKALIKAQDKFKRGDQRL